MRVEHTGWQLTAAKALCHEGPCQGTVLFSHQGEEGDQFSDYQTGSREREWFGLEQAGE